MPEANFPLQLHAFSFSLGLISASVVYALYSNFLSLSRKPERSNTLTAVEADDGCNSLFYDKVPGRDGSGFPEFNTTSPETMEMLRTVHPEYSRLPFELYKQAVECLPLVCVDVICIRNDGRFLLFYRRDKPAANMWWWPGGRLFRGETFYDTAIRKIRDETGNKQATVCPVGMLHVWNTFFPDSHWDEERAPGREGTQTVNVTVVCELVQDLEVEQEAARSNWAVEASKWVSAQEVLTQDGRYDKYITENVKLAVAKGFLHI